MRFQDCRKNFGCFTRDVCPGTKGWGGESSPGKKKPKPKNKGFAALKVFSTSHPKKAQAGGPEMGWGTDFRVWGMGWGGGGGGPKEIIRSFENPAVDC